MIKGIPHTLGDGKEYVIAPLTLGALEDLQDAISSVGDNLDQATITTMIDVAHASLSRNYPEMTRDEVRELIDIENMGDVFRSCMDVSGLKRRALEIAETGEPKAANPRGRRR
jgi:hypothetical protein